MGSMETEQTLVASESIDPTLISPAPTGAPALRLERGARIGRYTILERLGQGAMGVVYAAFDPELDRKVAIKLLAAAVDPGSAGGSAGRARLLREAQALARLNHPNVVAVHDAGTHEGRVWLAMEFVSGQTFAAWAKAESRPWPAVLSALIQAGRGLAAAHREGLVHRDFKPENVMVANDGRVLVMDFGLAYRSDRDVARLEQTEVSNELAKLSLRVTEAGAILGTPAYMAPEQFRGSEVGPTADQFAFCVCAWETLHGVRPFAGANVLELAATVLAGRVADPPSNTRVPGWLRRALRRGLEVEAAARWPDMNTLLAELDRGQRRRNLRLGLGVSAGLGVVALAVWSWQGANERALVAACESEASASWDDAARERVRTGLVATGVAHASITAEKVLPWLDAHADAWTGARRQACLDARVHGTLSADAYDHVAWCLDDRHTEFEVLVESFERADLSVLHGAIRSATRLASVDDCRVERVQSLELPAPDQQQEVREIRREISEAEVAERAGKFAESLELATAATERATAVGWLPLLAEAQLARGNARIGSGDYAGAEAELEQAYFMAMRTRAYDVMVGSSLALIHVVGDRLARPDDGLRWGRHAEIAAELADDPSALAVRANALANLQFKAGEYEQAGELYEASRASLIAQLGPEHPDVAGSLSGSATVRFSLGDFAGAEALLDQSLEIGVASRGPDHPDNAAAWTNLGLARQQLGDFAGAEAAHRRALEIVEGAHGPDHIALASILNNLATLLVEQGEIDETRALHERALAIKEKHLEPTHPSLAATLNNLGNLHANLGELDRAESFHRRALEIRERALDPNHPSLVDSHQGLGFVLLEAGDYAGARASFDRATPILAANARNDARLHFQSVSLARIESFTGHHDTAIERAEAALALEVGPIGLAEAEFTLAWVLDRAGRDPARARTLAASALERWRGQPGYAKDFAEVEAWLALHP